MKSACKTVNNTVLPASACGPLRQFAFGELWRHAKREMLIAALCAGNGVHLRRLRLWAIRPCDHICWCGFANPPPLV